MIPAQTESLLNQIRRMVEERHPDVQVCCFKIVLVNLVFGISRKAPPGHHRFEKIPYQWSQAAKPENRASKN